MVGDTCTYEGKWYKCKVDMSTGHAWTESEWDEMPTVKQFIESQVDALEQELVDGISVDEIEANGITIDGKKPSLEGHTHEMDEVSGLLDELDGKIDLSAMGFATFDPALTYQVGNTVAYNGHAYICST